MCRTERNARVIYENLRLEIDRCLWVEIISIYIYMYVCVCVYICLGQSIWKDKGTDPYHEFILFLLELSFGRLHHM